MDREFLDSKLDYHLFLYEQLSKQIAAIQKIVREHGITSFEALLENEPVRDSLLLKFILLQRTMKKAGTYALESRYKMSLKSFSWVDAEYFDQNCVLHYDCVWSLLQGIKPLKRQIERIKKYDDDRHTEHGDDVRCSFCGKSQQEVERMIAGPHEAICNECVSLCSEILQDVSAEEKEKS